MASAGPSCPDGDTRGSRVDAGPGPNARWARVKAVFLEALEHPESERSTFLERVTSDDAGIRAEVESLLASDRAAGSFCERPAAELLESDMSPAAPIARLVPGTRLGAYEIVAFIAAGGMGEVYRARHVVLGREMAIKTVGPSRVNQVARRRLIREARHASVLSHPNICAIHDVGDADGVPFIVMEYVDGRPLSEILREGVLPLADALGHAVQIADALVHAHAHGIIHRDLKSSNIVVDVGDKPVVLDFGLARRLPVGAAESDAGSTLTAADDLAGTLSHMPPEVLRGERPDARSDVWSLGVLLYELVTGELPFRGRTSFETSSAILGEPAPRIGTHVPLAVRLVIDRCLTKDPSARYQRADVVRDALDAIRRRRSWGVGGRLLFAARRRTLFAGAMIACVVVALAIGVRPLRARFGSFPTHSVSTIAILPLRNVTGDPRAVYYADGVTEALITELGAAGNVHVLSRASAMRVAGTSRDAAEAGTMLGADAVIVGSIGHAGTRVRLDIDVVVPPGRHAVWSRSFERDASEILALQADVVRALAGAVRLTLRPAADERLASARAVSPAVYEEYLKGRYEWNKRTPVSLQSAMQHFSRAVALDSTYAPAHAALADCLNQLGTVMLGRGSPLLLRPQAAAEAIRALQIDPGSAEAHAALGYAWHYDWRFDDAEREFRRAIELNPNYSMAHIWYANLLMSRRRMKEALEHAFAARELDPFSLIVNTNVAWVLGRAGYPNEAIVQLEQTLALDSTYAQARWRLAGALDIARRFPEALAQGKRLVAETDSAPPALLLLATIQAHAGHRESAKMLLQAARARAGTDYLPPAPVAEVFAALNQADSAMTWLERAFAERSNAMVYLTSDSYMPELQRDPRFRALIARVRLQ